MNGGAVTVGAVTVRLRQAGLAAVGLYVCLIASVVHRHTLDVGGVELPWAMLIGFVAAYSIARAVHPWVRLGDVFFALGWALGLTIPMFSPGGSYLIAEDWLGISFMIGGLLVLAAAVIGSSRAD